MRGIMGVDMTAAVPHISNGKACNGDYLYVPIASLMLATILSSGLWAAYLPTPGHLDKGAPYIGNISIIERAPNKDGD